MKTRQNKLQVESLERREMMAGDVRVGVGGGNIFITGDNARNQVQVMQVAPNVMQITGLTLGGASTTINGKHQSLRITGTPANVYVNLNGGDDVLEFGNGNAQVINVANDVGIEMGAGSDEVSVRHVRTGRDLLINTGAGANDITRVTAANVGRNLIVGEPAGVPIASTDRNYVSINSSTVRSNMNFLFGNGQDTVEVVGSAADSIYARMGSGNDHYGMTFSRVRAYTFDGGSGTDSFFASSNNSRWNPAGFERITGNS